MDYNKYQLKDIIRDLVIANGVLPSVKLALKVLEKTVPYHFESDDYQRALEELVAQGDIIEIQYVISEADIKVKSIYFPRGTKIVKSIIEAA